MNRPVDPNAAPARSRSRAARLAAWLTVALAIPAAGCGGDALRPDLATIGEQRTVIVILIDTLRADHTSLYGYERETTPFLTEVARNAIGFGRAYAPASWTRPSVASLFSSRIPESHGAEDRDGRLSASVVTLAEAFAEHGYATHGLTANGNVLAEYGFGQGFDSYEFIKDFPAYPYADAVMMMPPIRALLDGLGDDPAFVYLHFVDPHDPYTPHHDADYTDPDFAGSMDGSREALKPWSHTRPDDATARHVINLYDGEIRWFDARLGDLFAEFDERGLLDEAWIVITSDHGEGLWSHRTQAHGGEVFEEQIHVPLLIRPPAGLDEHIWISDPVSLIDVAPTLLDAVGLPIPAEFEGRSWIPYLCDRGEAPTRPVLVDEELENVMLSAVVDGDAKLIVNMRNRNRHLYDLATNPAEDEQLAFDMRARHSPEGTLMWRHLDRSLAEARAVRPADDKLTGEQDPEHVKLLQAMGYVGGGGSPDDGDDTPGPDGAGDTDTDSDDSDDNR